MTRIFDEITVESGEDKDPLTCSCCGSAIQRVFGFIYKNGDAYSVYHASWSTEHSERGADMTLQFGDWSEQAGPKDRFRVGLRITATDSDYRFAFIDPADSAWKDSNEAVMLSRAMALAHLDKNEFLRVAEHVLFNDPRLKDGLS
jgi:hypothetical protein